MTLPDLRLHVHGRLQPWKILHDTAPLTTMHSKGTLGSLWGQLQDMGISGTGSLAPPARSQAQLTTSPVTNSLVGQLQAISKLKEPVDIIECAPPKGPIATFDATEEDKLAAKMVAMAAEGYITKGRNKDLRPNGGRSLHLAGGRTD